MATGARRQRRVSDEDDDTDPGLTDPFLEVSFMSPTSEKQKILKFFLGRGRLHTSSEWTHETGKNRHEQ